MKLATLAAILVAALLFFAFGCTSVPHVPPGGNDSPSPPSDIPPPPPDSGTPATPQPTAPPSPPTGGDAPPPAPV